MSPAVSVIVPLYKVEPFVGECVDSLIAQSFSNFEVVLVDDCSPDDSLRVALEHAGDDPRFTSISLSTNSGLSVARNRGIEKATGDYLLFLDSDDKLSVDALGRLVETALVNDLDDLYFTAFSEYDNRRLARTNIEDYTHRTPIEGIMSGPDLFIRFQRTDEFVCMAQLHLVKKSFLDSSEIRFMPGLIHEDELYTVLCISCAKRAMFLNEQLYGRRLREGSIMTKGKSLVNVDGLFRVTEELSQWIKPRMDCYSSVFLDAFAQRIANLRDLCARHALDVPQVELDSYAKNLPLPQRLRFIQFVINHSDEVKMIYREYEESVQFKVGRVIMTLPRLMKKTF